ncbi:MAG: AAA family ATPase [Actinomycetota bacterium]
MRSDTPPIIGRDAERARLRSWLDADGTLLVVGAAGSGKTTLADELLAQVPPRSAVRLQGRPDAVGAPFVALLDALDITAEDVLSAHEASPTAALPDTRYRVHERVLDRLSERAAAHPVSIVVDDAQWLDTASMGVLAAAGRLDAGHPIRLALFARPPVDEVIEPFDRVEMMRLPPWSDEHVRLAARAMLGAPPDETLLAALRSGDPSPFSVITLAESLRRTGAVQVVDGRAALTDAATTIGDPIDMLVGSLEHQAADALRCAALLGATFSPTEASELAGSDPAAGADAFDALVRAGLLVEDGDRLRFRHDLVRERALATIDPAERRKLHARLADRAEASAGELHAHLTGAGHDPALVGQLTRAARSLIDTDPAAAFDLFQRALDVSPMSDDGLVANAARALVWSNRAAEALVLLDDHGDTAATLTVRAQAVAAEGRLHDAALAFEAAADVAGGAHGQQLRAEGQLLRALSFDHPGALSGADELLADPDLDDLAAVHAHCAAAWAAKNEGRIDESIAAAERAVDRAGDDPALLWRNPLMFLADTHLAADRYDDFERVARRARRVAIDHGDIWQVPALSSMWAGAHLRTGAWDKATAEAEAGSGWARETGNHLALPWLLGLRSIIATWRGEDEEAATLLAEAERELGGEVRSGAEAVLWATAVVTAAGGDVSTSVELHRAMWHLIGDLGAVVRRPLVAADVTRAAIAAGDDELAGDVVDQLARLEADVPGAGRIRSLAPVRTWTAGLLDRDPGLVRSAARELGRVGLRVDHAVAGIDAVELLVASGDVERAERSTVAVATQLDELGAAGLRRRLDGLVGTPVPGRPSSGGRAQLSEQLSPAELRVAELVATGASNPQVAEELFISRRTVESHLSHIYVKLGLSSRVELALRVQALD